MQQQQPSSPTMFCHDSTNIYYPTAPGRVYMIAITALADCDGSDTDYADSTAMGDLSDIMAAGNTHAGCLRGVSQAPRCWPRECGSDDDGQNVTPVFISEEEAAADFHDAVEQWADYCDRDSARLDSFDSVLGAIERAA